jgi:hypothetical protein
MNNEERPTMPGIVAVTKYLVEIWHKVNVRVFCYQLIAVIANTGIFVQNLMNYQR